MNRMLMLSLVVPMLVAGCSRQARVDRYLQRAEAFYERQRYPEAIIEYANVLKYEPGNRLAIRHLGFSLYETRDFQGAQPLLARAVASDKQDHAARTKLAAVYLAASDMDEALRLSAESMTQNPDDLDALLVWASASRREDQARQALAVIVDAASRHRGEAKYFMAKSALLARLKSWPEARAALDQAVQLAPDTPDAYLARGNLLMHMRLSAEAAADYQRAAEISPGATVAGVQWALFLRARGDVPAAREALDQMIASSPESIPARYERAALHFAGNNYTQTVADIAIILALNPDHLPSRLLRCAVNVRQGAIDEAIKELESLIQRFPRSAQTRYALARVRSRQGELDGARKLLQEALSLNPEYKEAALQLSEIDIQRGEYKLALGRLTPLMEDPAEAQAPALLLAGHAHRLQGNLNAAIASYERLSVLKPDLAEPRYLAGTLHKAAGRSADAIAAFKRALENDYAYRPALQGLVKIWMEQGDFTSAVKLVTSRLEKQPDNAELHLLRASIAAGHNDFTGAGASLARAIELRPDVSAAYRDLGRLYMREGRVNDAIAKLELARERDPQDVVSRMMLGTLYQQNGENEQAMQLYREVLARQPDFVAALNNLAYLLADTPDQLDAALQHAQRARALNPRDPAIADTLGFILLRKGMFPWAVMLLQESATELSDDPDVLYHLARALLGVGREDDAYRQLQRSLASPRDFEGRDQARLLESILRVPPDEISDAQVADLNRLAGQLTDEPSILYRQARWMEKSGAVTNAMAIHEQIIQSHPAYLPSLIRLTALYVDQPDKALAIGRRARELAPKDADVAVVLGRAAYRANDYTWSFSLLGEAARLVSHASPNIDYALSALMVGRGDIAREAAARQTNKLAITLVALLDAYENNTRVVRPMAGETADVQPLVQLLAARDAPADQIESAYRDLIATYPGWPWPLRDYAARRIKDGNVDDETVSMAARAKELMPWDDEAGRMYGLALAMSGQHRDAMMYLRDRLHRNPDDATARLWLARSELLAGLKKEAVNNLALAMAAGLAEPEQQMARAMMDTANAKAKDQP